MASRTAHDLPPDHRSRTSLPATNLPDAAPLPKIDADPVAGEDRRRIWHSEELLGESNEALILHAGETYRLRKTRQGKLILYK